MLYYSIKSKFTLKDCNKQIFLSMMSHNNNLCLIHCNSNYAYYDFKIKHLDNLDYIAIKIPALLFFRILNLNLYNSKLYRILKIYFNVIDVNKFQLL